MRNMLLIKLNLQSGFTWISDCLYGSECLKSAVPTTEKFLSCLCGSEQRHAARGEKTFFLSCLCGSEAWRIKLNSPI